MKKSLLALAVLGAFAGVASAQSSVTLFGTIDAAGRYVKNDGSSRRFSLATGALNSGQIGLRGTEDLGGGLKANFYMISELIPDSGGAGTTVPNGGNRFWNRRATVSLSNQAGEIRLGRDYVPSFTSVAAYDAFGYVGVGAFANVRQLYSGTRMDNAISYFLPANIGGWYGQAMVAAPEGGTGTADRPARYLGARFGFAAGPFDVAVAGSQERYYNAYNNSTAGGPVTTIGARAKQTTWNVGGSWDFGFAKLLGVYDHDKTDGAQAARESVGSVSAVIPFGQSEFHVGYDRSKFRRSATGVSSTVDQIKGSYVYNLSKRTALYGTISRLDNKDATSLSVAPAGVTGTTVGSGSATALPVPRGNSKGAEFGIRHFF